MILDDGGDATVLIHLGMKAEKDLSVLDSPQNEEEEVLFKSIKEKIKINNGWYSKIGKSIKGVTEETTTGVLRLYEMEKNKKVSTHDPIKDETKGAANQILFLKWSKILTSISWAIRNAVPDPIAILMEIKSE